MTMRPTAAWGRFYAEQRVLPYAQLARTIGSLSRSGADLVERICERLIAGEFDDDRPPARIHGDLWTGNLIFTAEGVVLIDPRPTAAMALLILRCCICSEHRSWR